MPMTCFSRRLISGKVEMKLALDVCKMVALVSLLGVVVHKGYFYSPTSSAEMTGSEVIDSAISSDKKRQEEIRKAMEYQLAKVFKFPESVKFKDVEFQYRKIFSSAGIELQDPEQEMEIASECGYFSAQNGLGAYGAYQPFYMSLNIINEKKALTGDVWFRNDGEVKKLISMDSSYPVDGDEEEFENLWGSLCGNLDDQNLGVLSGYDFGYEAIALQFLDDAVKEAVAHPTGRDFLNACLAEGVEAGSCLGQFKCRVAEPGDTPDYCKQVDDICLQSDSAKACDEKLASKREMSSRE